MIQVAYVDLNIEMTVTDVDVVQKKIPFNEFIGWSRCKCIRTNEKNYALAFYRIIFFCEKKPWLTTAYKLSDWCCISLNLEAN